MQQQSRAGLLPLQTKQGKAPSKKRHNWGVVCWFQMLVSNVDSTAWCKLVHLQSPHRRRDSTAGTAVKSNGLLLQPQSPASSPSLPHITGTHHHTLQLALPQCAQAPLLPERDAREPMTQEDPQPNPIVAAAFCSLSANTGVSKQPAPPSRKRQALAAPCPSWDAAGGRQLPNTALTMHAHKTRRRLTVNTY